MKRSAIFLLLVASLVRPAWSQTQWGTTDDEDRLNPTEYRDVDDGQFLKFASYVLTPVGMGLEWGLTRPLHYVATQTPLAPVLTGDKDSIHFGQNNNADRVPPETFAAPAVNYSNSFVAAPPEHIAVTTVTEERLPPSSGRGTSALAPGQPAIR